MTETSVPENTEEVFWWEVWLPVRCNRQAIINDFKRLARAAEIKFSERVLQFPEWSVLLAKGNKCQFARSGLLLNSISELRKAKEAAAFFDEITPKEQQKRADELKARLVQPQDPDLAPYVCILDTGVNYGYLLLDPFIDPADQLTLDEDWTGADAAD